MYSGLYTCGPNPTQSPSNINTLYIAVQHLLNHHTPTHITHKTAQNTPKQY